MVKQDSSPKRITVNIKISDIGIIVDCALPVCDNCYILTRQEKTVNDSDFTPIIMKYIGKMILDFCIAKQKSGGNTVEVEEIKPPEKPPETEPEKETEKVEGEEGKEGEEGQENKDNNNPEENKDNNTG